MNSPSLVKNISADLDAVLWHRILFIFFLFSLPLSIRKVYFVMSGGQFNEYLDISLFLSDILLVMTFILYILSNKNSNKSIVYWRRMFHVEHLFLPITIPLFLIVWSGLSIAWSRSIELALYSFIHLLCGYLLYVYILLTNVPRGTIASSDSEHSFHCSTWNNFQLVSSIVVATGVYQSMIAIMQFISQKSIGLGIFMESLIDPVSSGVAKVIVGETVFIRSYGLFPHPNVLGGYLAVSILVSIFYPLIFKLKMFHVEHSVWRIIYKVAIFFQILALLLTFSKSAIAGLVLGLIISIVSLYKMFHVEHIGRIGKNVPRGTFDKIDNSVKCSTWNTIWTSVNKCIKMFHVEHLSFVSGLVFVSMVLLLFNLKYLLLQPLMERMFYLGSLVSILKSHFIEGLGIGQFVYRMQDFYSIMLQPWQFQPIHNVYLLVLSELGLVGLLLFVLFFGYVFLKNNENVPRGTISNNNSAECSTWNNPVLEKKEMFHVEQFREIYNTSIVFIENRAPQSIMIRSVLIIVCFIMLFDHYFWDIQQGLYLLWIVLALAVSNRDLTK